MIWFVHGINAREQYLVSLFKGFSMKKIMITMVVAIMFTSSIAFGADKVGPFGLGVGTSALSDVEKVLTENGCRYKKTGVNKFTKGPMYVAGCNMGIDGLNETLYIFEADNTLAGVVIGLNKNKFSSMFDNFNSKYKLVNKEIPFVGNKFASFKKQNVTMELDSPHMSFAMEARYISDSLLKRFQNTNAVERESKKQKEAAAF